MRLDESDLIGNKADKTQEKRYQKDFSHGQYNEEISSALTQEIINDEEKHEHEKPDYLKKRFDLGSELLE